MIEFYMFLIQCVIFGTSLYFCVLSTFQAFCPSTWTKKAGNFLLSFIFLFAMLVIGFYWWDTIKTNNTFFSKPVHNLIELEVK